MAGSTTPKPVTPPKGGGTPPKGAGGTPPKGSGGTPPKGAGGTPPPKGGKKGGTLTPTDIVTVFLDAATAKTLLHALSLALGGSTNGKKGGKGGKGGK